jgi:hypothetical protein
MAGLLDWLFGGQQDANAQPGGDSPATPSYGLLGDPNASLAIAAGLLSGKKGEGFAPLARGLLGGMATYQQDQQQERANRQNDLQQIQGLYSIYQMQDMQRQYMAANGGPAYVRDPVLSQLEGKMAKLSGMPLASASSGSQAPQQPLMPATLPAAQASRYSPVVTPGPMPSPTPAQPPQADPFKQRRDMAALMAFGARKPELVAENLFKLSLPQLSRGVSFDPATGMPMAGFVNNIPTQMVNGRMQIIPNDLTDALAQREGAVTTAKEGAEWPGKPVTLADGRVVPAGFSGLPNPFVVPPTPTQPPQGSPGLPGFQGLPPNPRAVPQLNDPNNNSLPNLNAQFSPTPQVQASRESDRTAILRNELLREQLQPASPQRDANIRAIQTELNAQGGTGAPQAANDPWATMPMRIAPQGIGQSTFNRSMGEDQAKAAADLVKQYGTAADAANTRIATNTQALDLVDKADTGWLASHIAAFRPVLAAAGFPEQGYKAATDQALTKDLTNTALQRGKQLFGSRFTQSEVGIMLSRANPSIEMQRVAIKFLLETDNAMAKYAVQQSGDLGQYLQRGGDPYQFTGWYDRTFPASGAIKDIHLGAGLPPNMVLLPSGKTATFKSADDASAFRKAAGF